MAFDATVGGAASTSYVSVAAAEEYFLGRLNATAWDNASDADAEAALMMATAWLDREPYYGAPASTTQRLQWPRWGAPSLSPTSWGFLSATTIPDCIVAATCELALTLLTDPERLEDNVFQNLRIGSLDMTPRVGAVPTIPSQVRRLIASVRVAGMGTRVVRA